MEWVDLSNVECSMWDVGRSGEGRVGEEGRSWGAADHLKKKRLADRGAGARNQDGAVLDVHCCLLVCCSIVGDLRVHGEINASIDRCGSVCAGGVSVGCRSW